MSIKITEGCIPCGACESECPNNAIYEDGVEWSMSDGTSLIGSVTLMDGTVVDATQRLRLCLIMFIISCLTNALNAKAFTKTPNVLSFAHLTATYQMKCTAKRLNNCWQRKKNCTFNAHIGVQKFSWNVFKTCVACLLMIVAV